MLQPKKTKFRKQHKGRIHGSAKGGAEINFGNFALKSLEPERVTSRQIEVRMGKGKGSVDRWVAKVKPGRIMFEIDGVSYDIAKEALRLAAMKLPVKCKFVTREDW